MSLIIKFKKLNNKTVLPFKQNEDDAGYDLTTIESYTLRANEFKTFNTGLQIANYESDNKSYLRIAPRSGMAVNNGINVLAGVVDSTYRGEIKIILHNNSNHNVLITAGDRIAQMIPTLIESSMVIFTDNVKPTSRNKSGFGSTGL